MTEEAGNEGIDRHLGICRTFGDGVNAVGDRWRSPSSSVGWDEIAGEEEHPGICRRAGSMCLGPGLRWAD